MTKVNKPVSTAHQRFVAARRQRDRALDQTAIRDAELERDVWEAVVDSLEGYRSETNDALRGRMVEPFPPEIALELETALRFILAGTVPETLSILTSGPGSRRAGPVEKMYIERAVRYVRAAEAGLVDDPEPRIRVCELFGIKPRTLLNWLKKTPIDIDEFYPDAGNCDELITQQMFSSAEEYRKRGRSVSALWYRDSLPS